jgi:hypothetical protein
LRVAIVSLDNDVFVGRMFFGDQKTGKVFFDCDVRPSDGIFLALKQQAPIFVNNELWKETSKSLSKCTVHQMMSQSETQGPEGMISPLPSPEGQEEVSQKPRRRLLSPADFTELLDDDLDAIKLLKRKLHVAIKEEDYTAAASIRDHPYLIVYRDICQSKINGQVDRASKLEEELKRQVENNVLRTEPKRDGYRGKLRSFLSTSIDS